MRHLGPRTIVSRSTDWLRTGLAGLLLPAFVSFVLVLASCDGPTEPEGEEVETWTAPVGPDGGILTFADGAVRLDLPPGALSETVTISVQRAAGIPSGSSILPGTAYTFSPAGLSFAAPVTLTLSYESGQTDEPELLTVYRIDGSTSSPITSSVDPPRRTLSAEVTHFSTFAIGEVQTIVRTCDTDGSPWRWPVCDGSRVSLGQTYAQFLSWPNRNNIRHHHTGLDILPTGGTIAIAAVADGRVVARCRDGVPAGCPDFSSNATNHGLDGVVILEHQWEGGVVYTLYAHLDGTSVVRHTPRPGTHVQAGRVLGEMKDQDPVHLHFEVKRDPVLQNPEELEDSCVDPIAKEWRSTCYGYVTRRPDEHAFFDPLVFLHEVNPISQVRMEVTSDGGGAALRIGPGPYRIVKDASGSEARVQTGNQFDVELEAPRPTDDPECELGWVQVRLPDGRYFDDLRSLGGDQTLPRSWLCKGREPGREWIRFVEDEVRGRVVDQFAEIPLSNVTVTSSDGSVTTDLEGRFTVPVASSDDELVFSSSGIHTRRTFGQGSDLDWRVIPADFDMDLFDEVARSLGDLIAVAENDRTHKWTGGSPRVFIDTRNHEDDPKYAPGDLPQQIRPHVAEYIGRWSAGTVSPEDVILTDSPPADGTEGTIVIRFVDLSDLKEEEDGETIWALAQTSPWAFWNRYEIVAGVIELDLVSSGLNMDPGLVVGREIGHVFGMGQFQRDRPMMMREVTPPPGTEFSDFEADVADIVYSRLPGTRSPDTEERPAATAALGAQEQPVGGPFLSWVRGR